MTDNCIMCGRTIPEGRQVCGACEFMIMQRCDRCMYEDTDMCLRCKYWRMKRYDSRKTRRN